MVIWIKLLISLYQNCTTFSQTACKLPIPHNSVLPFPKIGFACDFGSPSHIMKSGCTGRLSSGTSFISIHKNYAFHDFSDKKILQKPSASHYWWWFVQIPSMPIYHCSSSTQRKTIILRYRTSLSWGTLMLASPPSDTRFQYLWVNYCKWDKGSMVKR